MTEEQTAVKEALEGAFLVLCPVRFNIQRIGDKKSIDAYSAILAACNSFEERLGKSNTNKQTP